MQNYEKLESLTGYVFKNKNLLIQSLTHSSYDRELCYERLEFLGDIILDAIVGVYLFKIYPEVGESFLTDLKAAYVNSKYLHQVGLSLNLENFIKYVNYEVPKLDDFVEAFIGALYLDGGWAKTEIFIKEHILNKKMKPISNHKNILLMVAKKCFESVPQYTLVKETGPSHNKRYKFKVKVCGKRYVGYGSDKNKKGAEMMAAEQLICKLQKYFPQVKKLIENKHL
ncbi:putative dsRNA-binding protein [bacterium]|nr:putative dsRNA-binding protein [bacterium]